jgi:hypothetical protein
MVNTDGDPLEFQTLYWSLQASIEEAVDALLPLTLDTKEEALAKAKRNTTGAIKWVELVWAKKGNKVHKGMENTLLSRLVLEPGRITAEVNSQKRAARLRKEIVKRLPNTAIFEKAVIESIERKMKILTKTAPKQPRPAPIENAGLQNAIAQMQKKHWDGWITESIPALGGLTPKRAAKTPEGREMLEALLYSFEEENRKRGSLYVDVDDLRRRLKLN